VQHYHVNAMGEVARKLDIIVSAGEQTYTLAGLADVIAAGVRMVQPDIVKMSGITGLSVALRWRMRTASSSSRIKRSRPLATWRIYIWRRASCTPPSLVSSMIRHRASTLYSKIP
jgi:hypothetical protein